MARSLGSTFHESVEEGAERLHRTVPALLATGMVGGIDVSLGVLAALLVEHETGSPVLTALAFSIGFVALTLANSELFTENFLVPFAAVVARKAKARDILRLWGGTAVTNLLGGALTVAIVVVAFPELHETAVATGGEYVGAGLGREGFASAVLAGIVITVMTWMQHGAGSSAGRIVAAVIAGFLLSLGTLSHVVVASIEMFAGMLSGADYGLGDWLPRLLLWTVGNMVGGLGLVTSLRLVQVGRERIQNARELELEDETLEGSRLDEDAGGPEEAPEPDEQDGASDAS